ncbi:MAG: hypothetical protein ACYCY5_00905 [Sulfuricella sp.]
MKMLSGLGFLLEYTQAFAQAHLRPELRWDFPIDKVAFDYEKRRWLRGNYNLPVHGNDFVHLTPKDILTKDDAWINRGDMLNHIEQVYTAMPDPQLRAQIESYFMSRLTEDAGKEDQREAAAATVEKYPVLIDHFIRLKEDCGEEAHRLSGLKVQETQEQFVEQLRALVSLHLQGTEFYTRGDSYNESMRRVQFLKDVIEIFCLGKLITSIIGNADLSRCHTAQRTTRTGTVLSFRLSVRRVPS